MVSEGIFINGEKVTFNPENILNGDISSYTEAIGEATQDWLDEHLEPGGSVPIDDTLSISGAAADAKAAGDAISELKEDLNDIDGRVEDIEDTMSGSGLSKTAVDLLNTILNEAVYGTDQSNNIALLYNALSNVKPESIAAVLDGVAYVGQAYSELDFVVTATFDDDSTSTVSDYTVVTTGAVTSGSNTVTIKWRGVTTTCTFTAENVTVYTMTYNLTDVALSNKPSIAVASSRYEGTLSVADNYYISSATVTMGGVDITSTALINNVITIAEVTGNVVITAVGAEYQYMDALIRTRASNKVVVYSDYFETEAFKDNYTGTYALSEYPALNNCTLHYTITNPTESEVSLANVGIGSVPAYDASYPSMGMNTQANIAYGVRINTQSGKLAAGASIEGTYSLHAGHQLAFITSANNDNHNYDKLTISIRGDYVADEFTGSTVAQLAKDASSYGSYRSVSIYSDNGVTKIADRNGSPYIIPVSLAAGTYDVHYRIKMDYSKWTQKVIYAGAMATNADTSVNYASGSNRALLFNQWFYGQMTVASDGMTVVTFNKPENTAVDGEYFDFRFKEVV